MTKIKRHPALLGALACLACLVAWAGYMVGTATAAGDLTPGPLFYKGYMTDTSGAPITGKQNVEIKVWSSKGVGEFCSTSKLSVPVDKGHFKIALKSQCAVLLHTYTAPWVEVFVAGKSLGLSKLGAAPSAARVAGLSEQSCPVG